MLSDVLKQDGVPDIIGWTNDLAIKTVGLFLVFIHLNIVYEYANIPETAIRSMFPLWGAFVPLVFLPNIRVVIVSFESKRHQIGLSLFFSIAIAFFLFSAYPYGVPNAEISQIYIMIALLPLFFAKGFIKMLIRRIIQRAGIELEDKDAAN